MANSSILAAFERMWQHINLVFSKKGHTHDDMYYTETEVDTKLSDLESHVSNKENPHNVTKEQIGIGETSESGEFTIYDAYIPELSVEEVDTVCGGDLSDVALTESQITTLYNSIL